jgi:RecB family exonuclease
MEAKAMPVKRVFLGWDRPALSLAVEYLAERFTIDGSIDLGEAIVAVPGARVGRRLLERLVEAAERAGRPVCPPEIITVGRLPEKLYTPQRPFADSLSQQLAWAEALRRAPTERLEQLMPQSPGEDDLGGWLSLGEMLARVHRELAAEAIDFQAVVDCGEKMEGFHEQERWESLHVIQRAYLATLDRLGLWDIQSARLYAAREGECHTDKHVVLIGTVDLNQLQRDMLEQVADRVTSLVFAPEAESHRFDDLGCLKIDAWQDLPVTLNDDQIEVVDGLADQAAAVMRAISAFGGRFAGDEITIGLPDERLVPNLLQQFQQCDLPARHGIGEPVTRTSPYRLLSLVDDYLTGPWYGAFAALVRHPAIGAWLARRGIVGDWLTELDRYYTEHLPYRLEGKWLGKEDESACLRAVHGALEELLRPLRGTEAKLGAWGRPIVDLLVAVYGDHALRPDDAADRAVLGTCEAIRATLVEHGNVCDELMPNVTAAEAIRFTLRAVAGKTVAAPSMPGAIELLGWLELPLDDAPALIVTGMNEGLVPTSLGADLFLPNQMRRALGIEDNDRRYARDAYALTMLAVSGRELKLIAGRRSPEGDPLQPSRLLLLGNQEVTARRVQRLFRETSDTAHAILPGRLAAGRTESGFEVSRPLAPFEPVESMRVTEFRDYLACPYRYYLRHRLRLAGLDDGAEEMDGGAFGSLAHEVLGQFGRGPAAHSTDAEEIAAFLDWALARTVKRFFGGEPLSAIRVQAEQLRIRLRRFAEWQAEWAARGWRIELAEKGPPSDKALLDVDDRPMGLRGRIDRIDVNEATGERIVLDYKTSDTVDAPDKTHRKKGEWVDLQLPLYRRLAAGLDIEGPVSLAYIALPKDASRVGLLRAEWTDADLAEAEEAARDVVRGIRAETFWPPTDPPPAFSEEFAAICQDGQFGAVLAEEDEGGGS